MSWTARHYRQEHVDKAFPDDLRKRRCRTVWMIAGPPTTIIFPPRFFR